MLTNRYMYQNENHLVGWYQARRKSHPGETLTANRWYCELQPRHAVNPLTRFLHILFDTAKLPRKPEKIAALIPAFPALAYSSVANPLHADVVCDLWPAAVQLALSVKELSEHTRVSAVVMLYRSRMTQFSAPSTPAPPALKGIVRFSSSSLPIPAGFPRWLSRW